MINQSFCVWSKEGKAIISAVRRLEMISSGDVSFNMGNWPSQTSVHTEYKLSGEGFSHETENLKTSPLSGLKRSSIVETIILRGRHQGLWIRAKVLRVKQETIDVEVLFPKKWKVVAVALGVPKRLIRAVKDCDLSSYTIPIEFTLDDSVSYAACTDKMRVEDLQWTIHIARGFPFSQIYFLHHRNLLMSTDCIPNDRIFCIIHRGEEPAYNLNELVSMVSKSAIPSLELPSRESSEHTSSSKKPQLI